MEHPARQQVERFAVARRALERGRTAEGAALIEQEVRASDGAVVLNAALHLAVEFNLIDLARDLARDAVSRYPRDAKLQHWAAVLAPPVVRALAASAAAKRQGSAAAEWLRKHSNRYRDRWVVLLGDELLAAGRDLNATLRRARHAGRGIPLVHFVRA